MRGDDELHRRRPVGVQDHHRVVVEGFEDFLTQFVQGCRKCAVLPVVELAADLFR